MVSSDAGIASVSNILLPLSRSLSDVIDDGAPAANDAGAAWGDGSDDRLATATGNMFEAELELN